MVDIPTPSHSEMDVSLQLLREQYTQTEESLWERLLVLEQVREETIVQLCCYGVTRLLSTSPCTSFPRCGFYEYGDSSVLEGYFRFTLDCGLCTAAYKIRCRKVFLLLSEVARANGALVRWEGRVYSREETTIRCFVFSVKERLSCRKGEWRAAERSYDPFRENEMGPVAT